MLLATGPIRRGYPAGKFRLGSCDFNGFF